MRWAELSTNAAFSAKKKRTLLRLCKVLFRAAGDGGRAHRRDRRRGVRGRLHGGGRSGSAAREHHGRVDAPARSRGDARGDRFGGQSTARRGRGDRGQVAKSAAPPRGRRDPGTRRRRARCRARLPRGVQLGHELSRAARRSRARSRTTAVALESREADRSVGPGGGHARRTIACAHAARDLHRGRPERSRRRARRGEGSDGDGRDRHRSRTGLAHARDGGREAR